ncbi:DUF5703 family protein [Brachybacterium phenoliresistens]|uniref:Uncharacterized protein n=1 Tax=Brachybacterium phenoliresistens TaxID=396014 RepID=Z9JWD0_9MICO|nr:hypothetical protein BF93_06580 [Brachybacterium phenoliresistens]
MARRTARSTHPSIRIQPTGSAGDLPLEPGRRPEDYEFQIVTIPRGVSISAARSSVTEEAEYGRWELARTRMYIGGAQKVWMRRRILRVRSTLQR